MQHDMCKTKNDNIIEINDDLNNVIHYRHEEFQLTKEDENIFFNPNGWLNDQHLGTTMQILHKNKLKPLGHEQQT
jgi:hypothetical protein